MNKKNNNLNISSSPKREWKSDKQTKDYFDQFEIQEFDFDEIDEVTKDFSEDDSKNIIKLEVGFDF